MGKKKTRYLGTKKLEALRVLRGKPPGGYIGTGGLHRLRPAPGGRPRPAGHKTRSAVGRLMPCRALATAHDLLLSLFDLPPHLPSSTSTPAHRQLARLIDEPRRCCHSSAITRVQATAATAASAKATAPELHTTAPAQGRITPTTSSSEQQTCAKD
jgi:hypothetical protein